MKTLENTSQSIISVECEHCNLMRDHEITRLYRLCSHCINDICYSDTFFAKFSAVEFLSHVCCAIDRGR